MIVIFGTLRKITISPGVFSFFQNFDFSGF